MSAQRRRDTKPEIALRRELHRRGLRYFVDRAPVKGVRRRADLVFPRRKVAVFVDGCFWHSCPQHATFPKNNAQWWTDKLAANVVRDRDTDARLAEQGWTVIRVWEHEDPLPCSVRKLDFVKERNVARWGLVAALALGGIVYSSWILEFFLDTGLDPVTSFLSELDAENQKYRDVFGNADVLSAILMLISGALGLLITPRRRLYVTGWIALAVFGIATIADASFPLECSGEGCPSSAPDGLLPQLHHVHALTSSVAVFAIFTAMIAFTVGAFRYREHPSLRTTGLTILILTSLATVWMLTTNSIEVSGGGNLGLGIAQRAQVLGMSLWLCTLAFAMSRPPSTGLPASPR
eukprot:gene19814-23735_t